MGFIIFSVKPVSLGVFFQRDEMERVNGETDSDHNARDKREWGTTRERQDEGERQHTGDLSPILFYPSPSQNIDSDKQTSVHIPTHTLELDTAGFESVEGHSMEPGPERQEEEDTQKEGTLSQSTILSTVCTHRSVFAVVF